MKKFINNVCEAIGFGLIIPYEVICKFKKPEIKPRFKRRAAVSPLRKADISIKLTVVKEY